MLSQRSCATAQAQDLTVMPGGDLQAARRTMSKVEAVRAMWKDVYTGIKKDLIGTGIGRMEDIEAGWGGEVGV